MESALFHRDGRVMPLHTRGGIQSTGRRRGGIAVRSDFSTIRSILCGGRRSMARPRFRRDRTAMAVCASRLQRPAIFTRRHVRGLRSSFTVEAFRPDLHRFWRRSWTRWLRLANSRRAGDAVTDRLWFREGFGSILTMGCVLATFLCEYGNSVCFQGPALAVSTGAGRDRISGTLPGRLWWRSRGRGNGSVTADDRI